MYIKRDIIIAHIFDTCGIREDVIYDLNYYTDPIHYFPSENIIEYQYAVKKHKYVGFIELVEYNFRLRKYKIEQLLK